MIRGIALSALVLGLFAPGARAEVKEAAANGFVIENSQVVPVDVATAWKALVEDVGRWWPADHTWWGDASKLSIQARAGGCFCEIDDARQAQHMTVAFVDPGKLLRMAGGLGPLQGMGLYGALEWRFATENDDTRITLHYVAGGYSAGDLREFAPVVDRVQGAQLSGLTEYLRTRARPRNSEGDNQTAADKGRQ